jgi:tryptophan synthase alpha chain
MNRFGTRFAELGHTGDAGLFPYLTAGYPDVETCQALAQAALDAGADGFEIGVPFSDPLADGATLQRANARALASGANLDTAFDLVRFIRARSDQTPVALMSYYNPLLHRGESTVAAQLADAGGDAVIVPDLPIEEDASLREALAPWQLDLVPFLAPTSSTARIGAVAALRPQPAFIYCVALVGVTGARAGVSDTLGAFLGRVRRATSVPLVVGFGIARSEHVRSAHQLGASGAIVASALVDLIDTAREPLDAARAYLTTMKAAGQSEVRAGA